MNQYDIESARKALDEIKDIVRDRDSARASIKEMREIENEMARKHAAEVDARIAEIKDLEAQLASRPVVESEAAATLREAWGRASMVARDCVCEWLCEGDESVGLVNLGSAVRYFCESAPPTEAPAHDAYTKAAVEFAEVYAEWWPRSGSTMMPQALVAARARYFATLSDSAPPTEAPRVERDVDRELREALAGPSGYTPDSISMWWLRKALWASAADKRVANALAAWLAAPLSPAETTLMLKRLDGQTQLYVTGTKEAIEYVQKMIAQPAPGLTPLEQAAIALAAAWADDECVGEAWGSARDRYLALRDGAKAMGSPGAVTVPFPSQGVDHLRDATEKVAPEKQETVDVWLAQYDDGVTFLVSNGLAGVSDCPTAERFLRVRLPVVEVLENEKGGA